MFILTLWDIGAVIFFLVCVVICLKTWIESNINAKQYERKKEPEPEPEPKPEPKKELEHGPNDKYAYFLLAVFIIAVAIVFIAMANSPSQ